MKILTRLTWANMKENRTRTIVTVIGVILSAAMFTAVTTLLSSAFSWGTKIMIAQNGNYHLSISGAGSALVDDITSDERVESLAAARELGYANAENDNGSKPYFYVLQGNEYFMQTMSVELTDGRLPQTAEEILLPEHYFSFGGERIPIGDTISLNIGSRQSGGEPLGQSNMYADGEEEIVNSQTRTFTVVGYYERPGFEPYTAPGYTAIVGGGSLSADGIYDIYFLLNNPSKDLDAMIESLNEGTYSYSVNWDLLAFSGVSGFDNMRSMLIGMGLVFILIIFVGSVSLIYSVFSISVGERTRQFGLLSSVGATAKQIRRSVFTEAALVCLMGVPFGCVCGVGGIAVTLYFLGDAISKFAASEIPMTLSVHPLYIVAAIVITVGTVLVSAMIPARRAAKLSAMEAIRQSKDIKTPKKRKNREYSPLFYKIFGVPAALARKYFSRSRKKYRNTIIALALSVLLFVSAGSFIDALVGTANYALELSDHDILVTLNEVENIPALENAMQQLDGVTDFAFSQEGYAAVPANSAPMTKEYAAHVKTYSADGAPAVDSITILYINDSAFNAMLPQTTDSAPFYDKDADVYLLCNHTAFTMDVFDEETQEYKRVTDSFDFYDSSLTNLPVFADIEDIEGYYSYELTEQNGTYYRIYVPEDYSGETDANGEPVGAIKREVSPTSYTIGAVTDQMPMGYSGITQPVLLRPISAADPASLSSLRLFLTSDDAIALEPELEDTLESLGIGYSNLLNLVSEEETVHALLTVVQTFSYGFIILISLLSAANVFNTISTNIALRRRDYAMLGSIGLGRKGLIRMMNYECLIYGLHALLVGLPLSVLASIGIRYVVSDMVESVFDLPWIYFAIAALSVFVVVFSSMLYSYAKLKKDSPVETLKDENI